MKDIATILGLTLAACATTGATGIWLLHLARRSSLLHQLTIATLVPVVAVSATVLINVRFMFLSAHDSLVVLVALGASLLLALLVSYLVMRRILPGFRQLGVGLHQLVADSSLPAADPSPPSPGTPVALPPELARVVDDLAETRRTLAEVRTRERMAEQARRDLVSFMSHDLRTPLAGLRALAEALEDGLVADVPRALAHLRSTVNRMTGLVDDLFALSRVQGPPETRPDTLVSLTEILTDVAAELSSTAQARRVQLDLEVPSDDRLAVLGAPDDLTRAVANLVANAIRHTESGLTVQLRGRRADDGHVQIAVIDACGGIAEENLARVFDTGWRGSASRTGDDGGAGLGLAIARGVVHSHEGEIAVRNVAGGCQFKVDLPPSDRAAASRSRRS